MTADGRPVWWAVAEGRRGRRWREAVVDDAAIRHSLLLETDPRGRFAHLELATAAGLLTLHPEADGTLHGNAIETAGIRHVAGLAWDPDGVVLVEASPVCLAAAVFGAGARRGGGPLERPVLRIDLALGLSTMRSALVPAGDGRWRVDATGESIRVDPDGLPVLSDGKTWPLELDAG